MKRNGKSSSRGSRAWPRVPSTLRLVVAELARESGTWGDCGVSSVGSPRKSKLRTEPESFLSSCALAVGLLLSGGGPLNGENSRGG